MDRSLTSLITCRHFISKRHQNDVGKTFGAVVSLALIVLIKNHLIMAISALTGIEISHSAELSMKKSFINPRSWFTNCVIKAKNSN